MLDRMRQRANDEGGFTLIELLVVILIIGILAAIAIPAFLSQTSKANDSAAKTQVGTMQTTMETYAAEHSGAYTGATLTELQAIEPTLKDTTTATAQAPVVTSGTQFAVSSVAKGSGNTFELEDNGGTIKRTCTVAGSNNGGCENVSAKKGTW